MSQREKLPVVNKNSVPVYDNRLLFPGNHLVDPPGRYLICVQSDPIEYNAVWFNDVKSTRESPNGGGGGGLDKNVLVIWLSVACV